VDGVQVEIVTDLVYELDADGQRLRTVKLTDYAGEKVRSLFRSAAELRARWSDLKYRREVLDELEARGIDVADLGVKSGYSEADPFDLLCHVGFNTPLRTRRERAEALQKKHPDFWEQYTPKAREVLAAILDKYAEYGVSEIEMPGVLDVPPISQMGTVVEIAERFGGARQMANAVSDLQRRLYENGEAKVA
jgi:type I restriction enzyme R subunit